jgi:hypothetical protein
MKQYFPQQILPKKQAWQSYLGGNKNEAPLA